MAAVYFTDNTPRNQGISTKQLDIDGARIHPGHGRESMVASEATKIRGTDMITKLDMGAVPRPPKGKNTKQALTARTHRANPFRGDGGAAAVQRVRPDYTEAELSRIHPGTSRYQDDDGMRNYAASPNLVQKMADSKLPFKHEGKPQTERKLLEGTHRPKESESVPGFNGMGTLSRPVRYSKKKSTEATAFLPELPERKKPMRLQPETSYNVITNQDKALRLPPI